MQSSNEEGFAFWWNIGYRYKVLVMKTGYSLIDNGKKSHPNLPLFVNCIFIWSSESMQLDNDNGCSIASFHGLYVIWFICFICMVYMFVDDMA